MIRVALALLAMIISAPAAAKVHETSQNGFVLRQAIEVPVSPQEAWDMFVSPAKWWSKSHSFSRDPANFSLDPRAGGCFCEVLPSEVSPNAAPRGSVEHMRVLYVEQPRAMRLSGGLGPLQSSAVNGVLTVFFKPTGSGTQVMMEYVVGGYLRKEPQALATTVDLMLAEQILRLGNVLGRGNRDAPSDGPVSRDRTKSDFEREMEAGLADPAPDAIEEPSSEKPGLDLGRLDGSESDIGVDDEGIEPEKGRKPPMFEGR